MPEAKNEGVVYTPDTTGVWRSCCFAVDRRCVTFIVQTLIGMSLLAFCAVRLTTESDCDRAAPYWGLIGTISGFFFNKMSNGQNRKEKGGESNGRHSEINN